MGLEAGTYVDNLVAENPAGTDLKSQGDNHLRLIKSVLKNTFPNATKAFRFPSSETTKSANYTVVSPTDDNKVIGFDAAGAARTVTLPTSGLVDNFKVTILKTDASTNAVIIDGDGNTISGVSTISISSRYQFITVIWNAITSQWMIFNRLSEFSKGTKMLFGTATAPVGWTKSTDVNDALIRLVDGNTALSSGGSLNFSDVFDTYTTEDHTLILDEIPAHDHGGGDHRHSYTRRNTEGIDIGPGSTIVGGSSTQNQNTGFSGNIIAEEGGGLGHGHNIELAVKYVDFIIAIKD